MDFLKELGWVGLDWANFIVAGGIGVMRKSVCRLKFMRFCSRGANRRLNATRGRREEDKSVPPQARKQLEKTGGGGGGGGET